MFQVKYSNRLNYDSCIDYTLHYPRRVGAYGGGTCNFSIVKFYIQ